MEISQLVYVNGEVSCLLVVVSIGISEYYVEGIQIEISVVFFNVCVVVIIEQFGSGVGIEDVWRNNKF